MMQLRSSSTCTIEVRCDHNEPETLADFQWRGSAIASGSMEYVGKLNLKGTGRDFSVARWRRGLSQVEVVVSTIIVSVLMVTSLSTIAASRRSQMAESDEVRGLAIAESMLTEITPLPMQDPVSGGFGIESDEIGPNRLLFDDVDDYRGILDSPPTSKSGIALDGYSDLSRSVSIDRLKTSNWDTLTTTYEGVYRITVRVRRGTREVVRVVAYRTAGSLGASATTSASTVN